MPVAPNYPSIPTPTDDPKALLESVIALKRVVEMLTGQDQGDKAVAHMFVQHDTPTAHRPGDMWFCEGATFSFNVWNGVDWIKVVDAIVPPTTTGRAYLNLSRFQRRTR